MDAIVYLSALLGALSVLLSARSLMRSIADIRAERRAPDLDPIRRWIAEEFVVTAAMGCACRIMLFVATAIVAAYRRGLVDINVARSWVYPFMLGLLTLVVINVWQEAAHLRLRRLMH